MNRRCYFIDSLCRHGNSGLTNPAPISLIPATIGHIIKIDGSKKGWAPNDYNSNSSYMFRHLKIITNFCNI